MKTLLIIVLAAATALGAPPQEQTKREELEATLVAFKGTVDVKRPEDKDWISAERNMKLKRGSEICTSVASTATVLLTGNIKIDVKPLTQAKVEDLAKAGDAVNADVKLKFGAIEVDIQKGDLRSDMKVSAPNSTTSVSGSHGIVRAPATEGGCRITLRTTTGTWRHDASEVGRDLFGADVADNYGNQLRDFRLIADSHDFLDFWGRNKDELYQSRFSRKAGDPDPWDVPMFEFVNQGPNSGRVKRTSVLPLPPGTP
ncbi:MAG TPA: FecR domain-containing protein [Planctomycetota bacterium]|nr:FecR domain-containing protein [Planctomycetota bacterium]